MPVIAARKALGYRDLLDLRLAEVETRLPPAVHARRRLLVPVYRRLPERLADILAPYVALQLKRRLDLVKLYERVPKKERNERVAGGL